MSPTLSSIFLFSSFFTRYSSENNDYILQELDLSQNRIARIEGLDALAHLELLDLSGNQIARMEGLSGLMALYRLILRDNHIQRVEGLRGLDRLTGLVLDENPISPTHYDEIMAMDPKARFEHNAIEYGREGPGAVGFRTP